MICPICAHTMQHVFNAQVLSKYEASYQSCPECGYLKVENPFWLEEAYGDAIARADTGIVMRNLGVVSKLAGVFYFVLKQRGNDPSLDVAGGSGLLTRLMRDIGFNFYWADVYCKNLVAPGFEYRKELGPCNAVTAIEVMEHLEDPIDFVQTQIASVDADHFGHVRSVLGVHVGRLASVWGLHDVHYGVTEFHDYAGYVVNHYVFFLHDGKPPHARFFAKELSDWGVARASALAFRPF